MKKKLITLTVVAVAVATSGYVLYRRAHANVVPAYRTAAVERGNLESTVAATGCECTVNVLIRTRSHGWDRRLSRPRTGPRSTWLVGRPT